MTDLSLIPMADLVSEIENRFDAVIVHAVKSRSDEEDDYFAEWSGSTVSCMGLCDLMKIRLEDSIRPEEAEDVEDGV